jgi:hypothetical protein
MFCGRQAWRRLAPGDFPAHDFDCVRCGRYRVGETAEARMRGQGLSQYADIVPKIIGANKDGFRLVLPSCFRVALAEEREISITATADAPVEQKGKDRVAAVGIVRDTRSRPLERST